MEGEVWSIEGGDIAVDDNTGSSGTDPAREGCRVLHWRWTHLVRVGANAAGPYSGLIQASNGNFYRKERF